MNTSYVYILSSDRNGINDVKVAGSRAKSRAG